MTKSRTNPLSIGRFGPLTARERGPKRRAMRIALYEPDIPQNTGTILRLAACLGVEAHIVEPAGFPTSDRAFRRAGMDYLDQVALVRHASWAAFEALAADRRRSRLVLFTTRARALLSRPSPTGRTTSCCSAASPPGVPDAVHRGGRRAAADPDAAGLALAQCRDGVPPWHWARRCGRRTALPPRDIRSPRMTTPLARRRDARSPQGHARAPGSSACATTSARRSRRSRTRCRRARRSPTARPAASSARPGSRTDHTGSAGRRRRHGDDARPRVREGRRALLDRARRVRARIPQGDPRRRRRSRASGPPASR